MGMVEYNETTKSFPKRKVRLNSMKKWIMFLCTVALGFSLAACAPMDPVEKEHTQVQQNGSGSADWKKEIEELKKMKPAELPEHLTLMVSENFQIDADFEISDELESYQVPDLEIRLHLFHMDEDFDKLLQLAGITQTGEITSKKTDESLPNGQVGNMKHLQMEHKNWIQLRDSRFMINRYQDTVYRTIGVPSVYTRWESPRGELCGSVFEEGKELSFLSVSDAKKQVDALLEGMGVEHFPEMKSYACTQEALQEQMDQIIEESRLSGREQSEIDAMVQTVTPADEGYCIEAEQGYHGIPYYIEPVDPSVTNYPEMLGTKLTFLVTEKGIINANVMDLYDCMNIKEDEDILPAGEMLDTFIGLHNDTIGQTPVTVKHMGLAYLPVMKDKKNMVFNAVPVYYVLYDQYGEVSSDFAIRECGLFDARTGEQL